jgi:1,2-diacylglycerol 3-alpha-glucosyltransferase
MYEDYTHYLSKRFGRLMKKTVINVGLKYANASVCLICPTSKVFHKFDEYGYQGDKVIIPSGIDFDQFKSENLDSKRLESIKKAHDKPFPHFIFVGRISHEKNIYTLLKNIYELNKKNPVYLTIIGDGPDKEEYMDYVISHGLKDLVTFTGMIRNQEIPYYYKMADAFVSFSKSETQGLTYIEALASNTPVFAHEDHHLHELIQDGYNGYLFKDDKAFIPLIEPFIKSSERLKKLQENGLRSVALFDRHEYGKNIEALYKEYLGKSHA